MRATRLLRRSRRIQWFDGVPTDCLFAVRSSGIGEDSPAQSFAGIHETLLDVPRGGLAAAVAACRASARSPRAHAYRQAAGLSVDSIEIAVLIQRMVRSEVSGVGFTVNPITGLADEIVINAARGLGEALVSGSIDPDEYIVRKGTNELLLRHLGEGGANGAAALSDDEIAALAALLQKVEAHYGAPQDVEWCRDGAGFWIVQSRPVTAVRSSDALDLEWTRANFAEVFPDLLSPQALAAFEELLTRSAAPQRGRPGRARLGAWTAGEVVRRPDVFQPLAGAPHLPDRRHTAGGDAPVAGTRGSHLPPRTRSRRGRRSAISFARCPTSHASPGAICARLESFARTRHGWRPTWRD